jgi:hypothetical protein
MQKKTHTEASRPGFILSGFAAFAAIPDRKIVVVTLFTQQSFSVAVVHHARRIKEPLYI